MFCSKCGHKNEETTKFCVNCGNNLQADRDGGTSYSSEQLSAGVANLQKNIGAFWNGYTSQMNPFHKKLFFVTLGVLGVIFVARWILLPDWNMFGRGDSQTLSFVKNWLTGGYSTMMWLAILILALQAIHLKTRYLRADVFVILLALLVPYMSMNAILHPITMPVSEGKKLMQEYTRDYGYDRDFSGSRSNVDMSDAM